MSAPRQRRLGQFAGVFIGLALNQVLVNAWILDTREALAIGMSAFIGFGLAVALVLGIGLIVRQAMVLSRIQEIESHEVAWDSTPMNDDERRWDGEMRWLGFRPLGSLQTQAPHGEPGISWAYADLDGRIAAEINRLTGSASFWTLFTDDYQAATRNRKLMPRISTAHYDAVNVDSPGGTLTPAYQIHVGRLHELAPIHGDAVHFLTIADVVAADERTKATLLPEVLAANRAQNLVGALMLGVAPAALLVILAFQIYPA